MISILVPTIRPQNIPALEEAVSKAVSGEYEFLWLEDKEREGCARTLDRLVKMSKYDIVCFLGDDTIPDPGSIDAAVRWMKETDSWLCGLNDRVSGYYKATHWVADKRLLDHLPEGLFFHTDYVHNADPELVFHANRIGRFTWCEKATLKHFHPAFGTAKSDPDYERVATQAVYDKDHGVFLERCKETRPLLGFVGIFKNEADNIKELLESVKPITDYWCIIDTGSTDGTQEIIRKTMEGIPGELHEEPFVDFAATRNRALDLLGTKTVFSLMLSGHETLRDPQALKRFMEEAVRRNEGTYYLHVRLGGNNYKSGRLCRTANRWRYSGVTHEAIIHPYERPGFITVEGAEIFHDNSKETAEGKRGAWLRDLRLLSEDLLRNPENTRTAFYLAQTYDCLRLPDEAMAAYERRIRMGGWPEEVFMATLRLGRFMVEQKKPWLLCMDKFLDAFRIMPTRSESLYEIAKYYREKDEKHTAYLFAKRGMEILFPKDAVLFVEQDVYDYGFLELVSILAFYVGDMAAGKKACLDIMAKYPEGHPRHEQAKRNAAFYEGK